VLDGEAPYAIARDFNTRGIPAPRGGSWDLTRVKRIVTSPTVAGQRVHRGQAIGPGDWPAILDHTIWTGCQAKLTGPARRTSHDDPHIKYLLTGIATCGICSTGLKTVKNRGTRTYSCPTCFKVGIKVDTLDDYLTRLAVKRLQRTDVINRMALAAASMADAAATARGHETDREERLDRPHADAATGETTRSELNQIEAPLNSQIRLHPPDR
jgi:site-specific DNA recombinase